MNLNAIQYTNDEELYSGVNSEGTVDYHILKDLDTEEFIVHCFINAIKNDNTDDAYIESFQFDDDGEITLEELIEDFNDYELCYADDKQLAQLPSDVLQILRGNQERLGIPH